jgi:hypothetical protein
MSLSLKQLLSHAKARPIILLPVALLVVAVIMVLGGCSSGPSSSEIERVAQEKVEQYLTRCGDSYIAATVESNGQLLVHQWIPAKVNVNAEELTRTDESVGIEWKGMVQVGSAKRMSEGVFQPALDIHTPQGWLVKKDGKWELFRFADNTLPGLQLTGDELKKVECSALPN